MIMSYYGKLVHVNFDISEEFLAYAFHSERGKLLMGITQKHPTTLPSASQRKRYLFVGLSTITGMAASTTEYRMLDAAPGRV